MSRYDRDCRILVQEDQNGVTEVRHDHRRQKRQSVQESRLVEVGTHQHVVFGTKRSTSKRRKPFIQANHKHTTTEEYEHVTKTSSGEQSLIFHLPDEVEVQDLNDLSQQGYNGYLP